MEENQPSSKGIILIIGFLILAGIAIYYFYLQRTKQTPQTTQSSLSQSELSNILNPKATPLPTEAVGQLFAQYPGAYGISVNHDGTHDVFYQGKVTNITEANNLETVTMTILKGLKTGSSITFTLPAVAPVKPKIGTSLKDIVSKGITTVAIRVRYNASNLFVEWELLLKY